jgi:hypothetical protein
MRMIGDELVLTTLGALKYNQARLFDLTAGVAQNRIYGD